MKNELTTFCRLISERISKFFKKSQNKKPTIVKNKIGFKLNFGVIQFERSKEWSSLSGENTIFSGDAGSSPALHSFFICYFSVLGIKSSTYAPSAPPKHDILVFISFSVYTRPFLRRTRSIPCSIACRRFLSILSIQMLYTQLFPEFYMMDLLFRTHRTRLGTSSLRVSFLTPPFHKTHRLFLHFPQMDEPFPLPEG